MKTVVLKLGGEVVQSGPLAVIADDLATLAGDTRLVIVHGGGPQATELTRCLGMTPNVVAGRRITDAATLDLMKMAIAGKVNVDRCAGLLAAGVRPIGLHGASALTVRAHLRPPRVVAGGGSEPIDFGHVGDVEDINRDLLCLLMANGYVPVVACLGADEQGNVFNINADIVANKVAIALEADGLFLVTDVRAVLRDVADPASRLARLTIAEGMQLIADGVVSKGMVPKLEESFAAIKQRVRAVHIAGNLAAGELCRAVREPGSIGTMLVA